jgi:hypothetical protein
MEILKLVEHAAWNYRPGDGSFLTRSAPARRGATSPSWRPRRSYVAAEVLILYRLPSSGGGESLNAWLHEVG